MVAAFDDTETGEMQMESLEVHLVVVDTVSSCVSMESCELVLVVVDTYP